MPPTLAYEATSWSVSWVTVSCTVAVFRSRPGNASHRPSTKAQLNNQLQNCFHHASDGNSIHAAEINWTFAQEARRARSIGFDQCVRRGAGLNRSGQFR